MGRGAGAWPIQHTDQKPFSWTRLLGSVRGRALRATVALALFGALLAGCMGTEPRNNPDPVEDGDRERIDEGEEVINGTIYRQTAWTVPWEHADLDVLIVPPAYGQPDPDQVNPMDSRFLQAVEDSITHWQEVIDEHGSPELRGNLTLTVQVLGRDVLVPDDVDSVDILIVHPPGGRMEVAGEKVLLGGFASTMVDRTTCVIGNLVHPLLEYEWLFMVSAHEFGHCLGLDHPDDMEPWNDLMSYSERNQPPEGPLPDLECVSNMNLLGVHKAFEHVFGLDENKPVRMPASDYEIYECADRFLPDD